MNNFFKYSILLLLTFSLILPNSAKSETIYQPEHIAKFRIEKKIGIINLQGQINDDSADQSILAFKKFKKFGIKNVIIHLDSLGGLVEPGRIIIGLMRDAKFHNIRVVTLVDHKEYCASMCTAIFAAGESRIAAADTVWIFHSPFVNLSDEEKSDPEKVAVAKQIIDETRIYMLSVYRLADPKFTDEILAPFINDDNKKDLILFGGEIIEHTDFITFGVVD